MYTVDVEKTPFYQIGLKAGIKEGIQEGIEKGKLETIKLSVKAFSAMGCDSEKIAELLHLKKDEVEIYLKEVD